MNKAHDFLCAECLAIQRGSFFLLFGKVSQIFVDPSS